MNEHDLLEAIGRLSEATIDKTALPDARNLDAAPHRSTGGAEQQAPIRQTKKRSVVIHAGAAAAVVALCIAMNAAMIYGIAGMRHSENSGLVPGTQLSEELQDMDQPYVEILEADSASAVLGLHNPTDAEITYSACFEVRQNGERTGSSVWTADVMLQTLEGGGYLETTCYFSNVLMNGSYELVNMAADADTEPVFAPVSFTVAEPVDGAVYIRDYTGEEFESVKAELLGRGMYLDVRETHEAWVPEGCISDMYVGDERFEGQKGRWLEAGTYLRINVSLGPVQTEPVLIPDFVNMNWDLAVETADGLGIVLEQQKVNDSAEEGTVLAQSIEAGTEITTGTLVTLQVSNGRGTVLMPDLTGWDWNNAKNTALELGLGVLPDAVYDSAPAGTVLAQSIGPDTEVQVGDVVKITYSNGKG